jgi:hypothetical protein
MYFILLKSHVINKKKKTYFSLLKIYLMVRPILVLCNFLVGTFQKS